jgi:hypothetical protein
LKAKDARLGQICAAAQFAVTLITGYPAHGGRYRLRIPQDVRAEEV